MKKIFKKIFSIGFVFLLLGSCEDRLEDLKFKLNPKKSYEYVAKWVYEFLEKRYSFWGNNPEYGEIDNFDMFQKYYHDHEKDFKKPMHFLTRLKLFSNWISSLSDGHLRLTFFNPIKDLDYLTIRPKKKISTTPYKIDYATYDDNLQKTNPGFRVIKKISHKEEDEQIDLLCGTFSNDILYLGFSGFLSKKNPNPINDFLFKEFPSLFEGKNYSNKIIIDLRGNLGGYSYTKILFSFLFTGDTNTIYGYEKKRISIDPKAQKGSWEKIDLLFTTESLKEALSSLFHKTSNFYHNVINKICNAELVILIDSNSASAAEFTAACIRQRPNGRVMLVGERTKGMFSYISVAPEDQRKPYEGGTFLFKEQGEKIAKLEIGTGICRFGPGEIEGTGISPHLTISGHQTQVEKALELLTNKTVADRSPAPPIPLP